MSEAPRRETRAYPVHLPTTVRAEAERLANAEGIDLDQFIAAAVAEKVAALRTAAYFAERRARVDWAAFDRFMARTGGEPPRSGDEVPPEILKASRSGPQS